MSEADLIDSILIDLPYLSGSFLKKRAHNQEYYQANKATFRSSESIYRERLRCEMVAAYGGKCVHCGVDNPIVLVLDHKFNQARRDQQLLGERGGYRLYAKLKRIGWPSNNYQLLCHNCNYFKEYERRRGHAV